MAAGDLVYFWIPVPDGDRAQHFYGELLGWKFAPGNVPGGSQMTNVTPPGGLQGGGEGGLQVAFEVDDLDAALARVRELGGEADDPIEIPTGRYAPCRDDQGVEFNLWEAAG